MRVFGVCPKVRTCSREANILLIVAAEILPRRVDRCERVGRQQHQQNRQESENFR